MQPANGAVFALDGILIGAGDTRFLMCGMLVAALGVFVPVALLSLALDLRDRRACGPGCVGLIAVRLVHLRRGASRAGAGRWWARPGRESRCIARDCPIPLSAWPPPPSR